MSAKLDHLGDSGYWRYVRSGERYSLGPLNHVDQTFELLGIEDDDPKQTRKMILERGGEIDMGLLMRDIDEEIIIGGESTTLNLPPMMSDENYKLLKERTIAVIQKDYPEIKFRVGSR